MNPNMICLWCGKMSHATRITALRTGRRLGGRVRLRVYRCPVGQGSHLTSKRPRGRQGAAPAGRRVTADSGIAVGASQVAGSGGGTS